VVAAGDDGDGFEYVGLRLHDGNDAGQFDVVVERLPGRRMAKVSPADLERYERVVTTGIVDGAEVTLHSDSDPVACYTLAGPQWAEAHGFSGSQHDGWSGHVARGEITHVSERVKDLRPRAEAGGGR
jgi:hypothetical protein